MGTLFATDVAQDDQLVDDDTLIPLPVEMDPDWSDDESPPQSGITAVEALADPFAAVASSKTQPYQAPVVDLNSCVIGGRKLHANVISAVTDAEVERVIDGASTFTLTLSDPEGNIRRSDLISRDVNCAIDGHHYRLANVQKTGTELVLTFESLGIALLRKKTGYKRAWRRTHRGGKGSTRAEFVLSLIREVKDGSFPSGRIPTTIPDLHEVRPVGKFPKAPKRRDLSRAPGLGTNLKIKGRRMTNTARENLIRALSYADDHVREATDKDYLSMLVSGIGESNWERIPNAAGSPYGGVLQGKVRADSHGPAYFKINDIEGMVAHFMRGGKGYHPLPGFDSGIGGAIALRRKKKDWSPGQIANFVEGSGAGEHFYQQHIDEAKKILKDWKTGGAGSTITYTRIRKFAFERQRGEDSWSAIQRLAQEDSGKFDSQGNPLPLGFRAFFVGDRFFWISEQQLMKSQSRMTISEDRAGVDNIDYEYDRGHPVAELTVTARAQFWTAPPGTVITVENMATQVDGKWLVNTISRHRGDLAVQIQLDRAQAEAPEPAPPTEESSLTLPGRTSSRRGANSGVTNAKTPGRIDQGVDFTGRGNVNALADGIITRAASSGTGWPGGTMIVQKLDEPVRMHGRIYRFIYYAENIQVRVRRGQRIAAGDPVGFARGVFPFIEVGWANDALGTTYARAHGEADLHPNHSNTPAGQHFFEWLGYTQSKGYSPGGGPFGTGHIESG